MRTRTVSADGRTAIWPSVDGSIVFGKVDEKIQDASESAVLVAGNQRRQIKVMTIRRFLREEREKDGPPKGGENITHGWFTCDPRRQHKADIDTARAHKEEVVMSLDDRGCVVS